MGNDKMTLISGNITEEVFSEINLDFYAFLEKKLHKTIAYLTIMCTFAPVFKKDIQTMRK